MLDEQGSAASPSPAYSEDIVENDLIPRLRRVALGCEFEQTQTSCLPKLIVVVLVMFMMFVPVMFIVAGSGRHRQRQSNDDEKQQGDELLHSEILLKYLGLAPVRRRP
jgi:hypothetical protein